jgi:iron complex transport system ATP-binding protein
MLEVRDLTVSLNSKLLLPKLSFALTKGSYTVLLGRNGSGKTTLLRALLGQQSGQTGDVFWQEQALGSLSLTARAAQIAYVSQSSAPPLSLPVLDYVLLGRSRFHPWFAKPSAADRVAALSALANTLTSGLAQQDCASLSGGEGQRVKMARALAQSSACLILDEPTAHLDLAQRAQLMQVLRGLAAAGHTLLLSSHEPRDALLGATQLMLLSDQGLRLTTPQAVTASELASCYGVAEIDENTWPTAKR